MLIINLLATAVNILITAVNVWRLICSSNKRIADLEIKVQDQQKKIMLLKEATITGKKNDFVS